MGSSVRISTRLGVVATILGALGLLGWFFGTGLPTQWTPGIGPMSLDAALGLFIGGLSVVGMARARSNRYVAYAASVGGLAIALLGLADLVLVILHYPKSASYLLSSNGSTEIVEIIAPMAPAASVTLIAAGVMIAGAIRRDGQRIVDLAGVVALAASTLGFSSLIYASFLGPMWSFRDAPALATCVGLFSLSLGAVVLRSDRGLARLYLEHSLPGLLLRRLLPAAFFVPFLIGLIELSVGPQRGTGRGPIGVAYFVFANIVVLTTMVLLSGTALRRVDARREAADRELRESERRFRALADSMPQIVWIADASGAVQYANAQWAHFAGPAQHEGALGWGWQQLVHPDDLERVVERWKHALATGETFETEERFRRHDGEYRWFLNRAVAVRDPEGRVEQWHGTATDVHEIHALREALALGEERFRTALFQSPVMVFNQDCELRYTWVHNAEPELLGRRDVELTERREDGEAIEALKRTVLETGEGVRTLARAMSNGELREFDLTVEPLRRDDAIVGITGAAVDVTDRKRAEESLRQTQKLELLGILAGGIAHDFNNLLTGILGSTSLAMVSLSPESRVRAAPLIEDAMHAAEQAAELTEQLLVYAGKGTAFVEPLDLGRVVEAMRPLLRTSIPKGVELRIDTEPWLPQIEADVSQLRQVIMNIAINGAEAIDDGYGVVQISARRCELGRDELLAFPGYELRPGPHVSLEVCDTGVGMDDTTLARVFEPFFTTKFQGRGLGLAAVEGIVRSHRGAIRVESREGRGTVFRVVFPVCEPISLEPPMVGPGHLRHDLDEVR